MQVESGVVSSRDKGKIIVWFSGTGPEGSPFSNLVDSADNKNGHLEDVPVAAKITPNEKFGNMKEINSKVGLS